MGQKILHIRRCHVCGETTEGQNKQVDKCASCGKHFAPFFFSPSLELDPEDPNPTHFIYTNKEGYEYTPLRGLSAYW